MTFSFCIRWGKIPFHFLSDFEYKSSSFCIHQSSFFIFVNKINTASWLQTSQWSSSLMWWWIMELHGDDGEKKCPCSGPLQQRLSAVMLSERVAMKQVIKRPPHQNNEMCHLLMMGNLARPCPTPYFKPWDSSGFSTYHQCWAGAIYTSGWTWRGLWPINWNGLRGPLRNCVLNSQRARCRGHIFQSAILGWRLKC